MNTLNAVLVVLGQAMFAPLAGLPAWLPLVLWSLILGMLAALCFRYTSPQAWLRRVSDRTRAHLLSMKLFKDELGVTFRAICGLLYAAGQRLAFSLPTMAVLLIPFALLIAQVAMWYEFRPLKPGEFTLVEMRVRPDDWPKLEGVELHAPQGLAVETRVRDAARQRITWRVRAEAAAAQPYTLTWEVPGLGTVAKQLVVDGDGRRLRFVSPTRAGASFWDRLLYPGEPAFDATSAVQQITVQYGSRSTPLFGLNVHWLITFLVVSILGAFALKPFVRVQF